MLRKIIRLWRLLDHVYVDKHTICIQKGSTQLILNRSHLSMESLGDIHVNGKNVYLNCDQSFTGYEEVEQLWAQERKV